MVRTLSVLAAVAGMGGVACGAASAQQSGNGQQGQPAPAAQPAQQPAPQPAPQPQVIRPTPSSPLGGVPSAAPRPADIRGVPAALPQVTPPAGVPSRNTPVRQIPILPPPQGQTPPVVNPSPGVPPVVVGGGIDNTRSALVRRLLDAKYGPGYSLVNGQVVQDQPPMKKMMTGGWPSGSMTSGSWVTPAVNPIDNTVHGLYTGNDFRLGFFLGNGFPTVNYRSDYSYGKYPQRLYRSYYSIYEDADRYWNNPCAYNPYLVVGPDRSYVVDPRLTQQTDTSTGAPLRELTPLEKAEIALKSGDASDAVKQLKLHMKESPDDAGVERLLAMALIDDRKVDQGVAVLMHAYTKQPQLAADPIEWQLLSGGEAAHRQRFSKVMEYANRTKTSAAYLAASALAQSEGRFDVAKKMLDKAVEAGLDGKVAEEMRVGIANR